MENISPAKTNPSKKIREIRDELGDPYEIKTIDFENVIYRNLGNGYDLEVSRLDNNKKSFSATIYVWDISKGTGVAAKIIEEISDITSLPELKNVLKSISEKYLKSVH